MSEFKIAVIKINKYIVDNNDKNIKSACRYHQLSQATPKIGSAQNRAAAQAAPNFQSARFGHQIYARGLGLHEPPLAGANSYPLLY